MSADAHSRLCPEHRSDSIPTGSCVACAQARRIHSLETTVERLAERVEALEADRADETANTTRESTAIADGGEQ